MTLNELKNLNYQELNQDDEFRPSDILDWDDAFNSDNDNDEMIKNIIRNPSKTIDYDQKKAVNNAYGVNQPPSKPNVN